jgi:hypothetical protein
VGGVGDDDLLQGVAARVVIGLREEAASELTVSSGRRLQGRLVQAGDLGENPPSS